MGAAIQFEQGFDLVELTKQYQTDKNLSIQEFANRLNISRSALSRYLSRTYDNPTTIEEKLNTYYEENNVSLLNAAVPISTQSYGKKAFYESTDARRVIAVCNSCQEFVSLGVVIGKSGFGKTHTLKHYAKLPNTSYVECDDTMSSRDLVEAIERSIGISQTYGTIWKRVNGIREHLNQVPGTLIIIDEADKLLTKYTQKKMEILRAIVDQAEVGMVVAGEPKLKSLLEGYLPRFANRVDFFYSLCGLTKTEVLEYLENFPIEDNALAELVSRANNARNGCFRLLDRTLKNVLRLMRENGSTRITLEMIEKASDMMML